MLKFKIPLYSFAAWPCYVATIVVDSPLVLSRTICQVDESPIVDRSNVAAGPVYHHMLLGHM